MAQLKSFKYLESEETKQPEQDEDNQTTTSISSQSISTIAGGNLTSSESESDQMPKNHSDSAINQQQQQQLDKNSDTTETTDTIELKYVKDENKSSLSSNEEYQTAQVDITSEEDDELSTVTKVEIINQTPPGIPERGSIFPVPGGATPDIQRGFLSKHQQQQHINSPVISPLIKQRFQQQQQPSTRSMSPALKRQSSGDNVSQHSLGMRRNDSSQNFSSAHFEIRWHNINLMARKSKLPSFIADNKFYKLIKGRDDNSNESDDDMLAKKNEKIYYSPPIRHKMIPPTISEDSELNSDLNSTKLTDNSNLASHFNVSEPIFGPDQNPADYRPILVNVSGSVFSGQLTAVLGPSGVGKTMLLNSLTGRNTLEGTGRVSLIGAPNRKRMSVVTVPQADVLPAKLTTLEDLQFTSRIKNPQRNFDHKRNIERIVKHLQMEKFLHTRIEKLSGGEERRLSIARELLSSPDILILDEPTSGLDANTCKKIIMALRDIVEHSDYMLDRPMSIIVTIHQPQQEVLNLFHRVYVMAIGGRSIYEGPPTSLLSTLVEQSSLSRVCAIDQLNDNPAIVALEVASGEYGSNVIGELAMHHESQFYEESLCADQNGSPFSTPRVLGRKSPLSVTPRFQLVNRRSSSGSIEPTSGSIGRPTPVLAKRNLHSSQFDRMSTVTSLSYASTYDADLPEPTSKLKVDKRLRRSVVMKSSFISHTWTLMQRNWLLTTRDLFLMSIRIIGFILVAGGVVQIFSHSLDPDQHLCPEYETEVSDVSSFMETTKTRLASVGEMIRHSNNQHTFFFHLVLCIVMVSSALTGLVFPMQMRMFIREYKNGWYSPASFTMSNTLAELPVDFIGPTISIVLTYQLCNQPSSMFYWREIAYIFLMIIASNLCKSQAQIIGSIFMDSVQNSVFLSCVAVTLPALLSGIAVRVSQMSYPLQILSYTSFLRYTFECLFLVRYGLGICPCDPEVVNGYPATIAADTIPAQLNNFARGIIELNLPINSTSLDTFNVAGSNSTIEYGSGSPSESDDNIFLRFLRLVTDAGNLFVPVPSDLGNCKTYRSLYLIDMDIPNDILPKWTIIMLSMYIISRFLTYFVIKAVIKIRRR